MHGKEALVGRPRSASPGAAGDLRAVVLWSAAAALALSVALFAARRLAGALHTPLSWPVMLVLGMAAATLVGLSRWGCPRPATRLLTLGLSAGLVAAVWIPGDPLALAALALPLVAVQFLPQAQRGDPAPPATAPAANSPADNPGQEAAASHEHIWQQITRAALPEGGEVVRGTLRLAFEPGQRLAAAHVAFCPPLACLPRLSIAQHGGPPADVQLGQVLPWGARLDVRLARPTQQAAEVIVEFTAQAEPDLPDPPPTAGPIVSGGR